MDFDSELALRERINDRMKHYLYAGEIHVEGAAAAEHYQYMVIRAMAEAEREDTEFIDKAILEVCP
jgi:hypothetical protein